MADHGIFVTEKATSVMTPIAAESGVPFVVGTAPAHSAESPAPVNVPVLCESWSDAVEAFGYSDDWETYTLCEFMHSHFKLYGCKPVVMVNVLDQKTAGTGTVESQTVDVSNHRAKLPIDVLLTEDFVVATQNNETTLSKGADYNVYYEDGKTIIELISGKDNYNASQLNVKYTKIKPDKEDVAKKIAEGIEAIEVCATKLGMVPDLICAPGWSDRGDIAAAMAVKAESINGIFKAKAIIDLDASTVRKIDDAVAKKKELLLNEPSEIVCWPMGRYLDKTYHLSTLVAGTIAATDTDNDGVPYASPSNHPIKASSICLKDGTEVLLTFQQGNSLGKNGIVTAINFLNGWTVWNNYTAAYPLNMDVKDYFIPVSRMFAWVGNSLIRTFWHKLDAPMNRRLIETILDTANIWLNGLTGRGCLLGGRVEMLEDENPVENLMAGILKLHVYITPPSPAQEINFVLEYDAEYVTQALQS